MPQSSKSAAPVAFHRLGASYPSPLPSHFFPIAPRYLLHCFFSIPIPFLTFSSSSLPPSLPPSLPSSPSSSPPPPPSHQSLSTLNSMSLCPPVPTLYFSPVLPSPRSLPQLPFFPPRLPSPLVSCLLSHIPRLVKEQTTFYCPIYYSQCARTPEACKFLSLLLLVIPPPPTSPRRPAWPRRHPPLLHHAAIQWPSDRRWLDSDRRCSGSDR